MKNPVDVFRADMIRIATQLRDAYVALAREAVSKRLAQALAENRTQR